MSAALRAYERAREHGIGIGITKAFDLGLGLDMGLPQHTHYNDDSPDHRSSSHYITCISYKAPGTTAQHRTRQTDRQTQATKVRDLLFYFHFYFMSASIHIGSIIRLVGILHTAYHHHYYFHEWRAGGMGGIFAFCVLVS